jgi:hypothetical protein
MEKRLALVAGALGAAPQYRSLIAEVSICFPEQMNPFPGRAKADATVPGSPGAFSSSFYALSNLTG